MPRSLSTSPSAVAEESQACGNGVAPEPQDFLVGSLQFLG